MKSFSFPFSSEMTGRLRRVGLVQAKLSAEGEGMPLFMHMVEASGGGKMSTRGVSKEQPERRMQPSRVRWFRNQAVKYHIWKNWCNRIKQVALSPRVYGNGT